MSKSDIQMFHHHPHRPQLPGLGLVSIMGLAVELCVETMQAGAITDEAVFS